MTHTEKVVGLIAASAIVMAAVLFIARPAFATGLVPSILRSYAVLSSEASLRPSQNMSSAGPTIPAGTRVETLNRGTLTRVNGSQTSTIYRVKVVATGAIGWIFLDPQEIAAGSAPASTTVTP